MAKTITINEINELIKEIQEKPVWYSRNKVNRLRIAINERLRTLERTTRFDKECARILKDDTAIYMFCSWHHIDFFKIEFEKYFNLKNLIVWNKNNHGSGDLKGSYAPKHEFILYGHKGRSLLREKRISDVIDCAKVNSNKLLHPTEKPIPLLETFIQNSSDKGDLVFDGFLGSATTAIACINTNRNYIGFELDEEYFKKASERIEKFKSQIRMF